MGKNYHTPWVQLLLAAFTVIEGLLDRVEAEIDETGRQVLSDAEEVRIQEKADAASDRYRLLRARQRARQIAGA